MFIKFSFVVIFTLYVIYNFIFKSLIWYFVFGVECNSNDALFTLIKYPIYFFFQKDKKKRKVKKRKKRKRKEYTL